MNNFILLFINTLSHIGVFTKDEAEKLCKEMHSSTLPDSFEGSYKLVKDIFSKLEIDPKIKNDIVTAEKVVDKFKSIDIKK